MDAPLSPQISLEDPACNVSFLATLSTDASGAAVPTVNGAASAAASDDAVPADDSSNVSCLAVLSTDASGAAVSPVDGAASAAASDDAAPVDDSRAPTALHIGAAGGTVSLVAGAAVNAAVLSAEEGALAAPPTDAVWKTVPPVDGAAAGTAADATPIGDVGVSATPFGDIAGNKLVPVTASAAGVVAASATAVGADCCGPSDRENIGISILPD